MLKFSKNANAGISFRKKREDERATDDRTILTESLIFIESHEINKKNESRYIEQWETWVDGKNTRCETTYTSHTCALTFIFSANRHRLFLVGRLRSSKIS